MSLRRRPRVLKRAQRGASFPDHDVGAAARDEGCRDVLRVDAGQRRVGEVDLDLRPRIDAERTGAGVSPEVVELVGREDATAAGLTACDAFELAELLER